MAGGIVASSVLAYRDLGVEGSGNIWLLFITFLIGFVMVSNFRYRSFKELDLRERLPFRYLVLGVLIFIVVAWWPEVMLFVLFLSYAILGAIFGVLNIGKGPRIRRYVVSTSVETDLLEEDKDDTH
jgi:CDP-diacylglycerol--serine O-phosphatidyltransferase